MLPRLQVDAVVACFLLKYFGEERFPGISDAQYLFFVDIPRGKSVVELEREGHILLDMGGGKFDHHVTRESGKEKCLSQMVAEYLGVEKNRALRKLLEYARRDDLEGKGTLSKDPIDRAFGLSGLVNDLNRMLPDDQEAVLLTVMPLLMAQYGEEKKRAEDLPAEYEQKVREGKARIGSMQSVRGSIRVALVETDEIGMAGYLRGQQGVDMVVQKMSSGHVNIITHQKKEFDLSEIVKQLRKAEIRAKGTGCAVSEREFANPGRIIGVEEWYFDTKAKTIQNGGIRPQGTIPTKLSPEAIIAIIKEAVVIKL